MMMRWKDSPDKSMCTPGNENKVMHSYMTIGETGVMISDGRNTGNPKFDGFALSIATKTEAEAEHHADHEQAQGAERADPEHVEVLEHRREVPVVGATHQRASPSPLTARRRSSR